jgi:nucleoid-associated protein YgaU
MPIRIVSDDDENFMSFGEEEIIYEVQKGDTLSKIAAKFYGDPQMYNIIYQANLDLISNPDYIQVGWKLKIPKI